MKHFLNFFKTMTFVTSLVGALALAYKDGTYVCKNGRDGLPNNIFKVSTVSLGSGIELPYFDSTRYYKNSPTGPVLSSQIRGIASQVKAGNLEILTVAAVSMEFEGDTLLNCDAP